MHYDSIKARLLFRARKLTMFNALRTIWWRCCGAQIGSGTRMPRSTISWPHQVRIGSHCVLEADIYFKYDGPYRPGPSILIGDHCFIGRGVEFNITKAIEIKGHCLIGSGSKFVDHDHGVEGGDFISRQTATEAPILVGSDVWIGDNVVVLKGVNIGDGAVVGAGAVVTKSIPKYEIWAGVPAVKIGERPRTKTTRLPHPVRKQ